MVQCGLSDTIMQILVALGDGPLHGYAVLKQIQVDTDGQVKIQAPTLYRNIHTMLEQGLIEEIYRETSVDKRRRYYQLTEHGMKLGQIQLRHTFAFARIAQDRLVG